MVLVVSSCHLFAEALKSLPQIFNSLISAACCCWRKAKQLSPFSQPQGWVRGGEGGVTWPRCSAALTRGLLKSLSRLAAINTAVHPLRRRSV